MKPVLPILFGAIAVGAGLTMAITASAGTPSHARISYEAGGAMVRGPEDADWSFATINTLILPGDVIWSDEQGTVELEMEGGNFLRMADGSRADITSLPPSAVIEGWAGAFYVHRVSRSQGDVVFRTPAANIEIERDSMVRVDILDDGATTVTVRWGRAHVRTDEGGAVALTGGKRVFIDPGYLPSSAVSFDRSQEDEFDRWNRERARLLAEGMDNSPIQSSSASAPIGVSDLHHYGTWVRVDGRSYWRPTVVREYVPYRTGYWSYAPRIGYSWIGPYPFTYVTSHYGRWTHHSRYGWMWTYVDGWAPAHAYTVRSGPYFVWGPLDYRDRPVVVGSAYFTIDGLRIGIHSSSYARARDVLYYGVAPVYPASTTIITTGDVHIWNIYGSSITRRPAFHRRPSVPVRDYSPRRVIRGPDIAGPRGVEARSRIADLQTRLGRDSFARVERTGMRAERTAGRGGDRTSGLREVSMRGVDRPSRLMERDGRLAVDRGDDERTRTAETRDGRSIRGGGGAPGAAARADARTSRPGGADSDRGDLRTGVRSERIADREETISRRLTPRDADGDRPSRAADARERTARDTDRPTLRGEGERSAGGRAERTTPDRPTERSAGERAERTTPDRTARAPERPGDASDRARSDDSARETPDRTTRTPAERGDTGERRMVERGQPQLRDLSRDSERTAPRSGESRATERTPVRSTPPERGVTRDRDSGASSQRDRGSQARTLPSPSTRDSSGSAQDSRARTAVPRQQTETRGAPDRPTTRSVTPDRSSVRGATPDRSPSATQPRSQTPSPSARERVSRQPAPSSSSRPEVTAPRASESAPRVTGSAPRVTGPAPRVTGPAPRVTTPDPPRSVQSPRIGQDARSSSGAQASPRSSSPSPSRIAPRSSSPSPSASSPRSSGPSRSVSSAPSRSSSPSASSPRSSGPSRSVSSAPSRSSSPSISSPRSSSRGGISAPSSGRSGGTSRGSSVRGR